MQLWGFLFYRRHLMTLKKQPYSLLMQLVAQARPPHRHDSGAILCLL